LLCDSKADRSSFVFVSINEQFSECNRYLALLSVVQKEEENAAAVADKLSDLQGKKVRTKYISTFAMSDDGDIDGLSLQTTKTYDSFLLLSCGPVSADGDLGELNLDKKKKKKKKAAIVDVVCSEP
jgi:hypothetical protein